MKVVFLHLCDMHINSNINGSDLILNALKGNFDFDESVVIISGDVAFSGKESQYTIAKKFIDDISSGLKIISKSKNLPNILVVPGNHDKDFDLLDESQLSFKYSEEYIDYEITSMKEFFKFSKNYDCFNNNKLLDIKRIDIGDVAFRFNLLNTAIYSNLDGNNNDKGLHYLPNYIFDKLSHEHNEKINITICHHSPEWFEDKSKNLLLNNFNNINEMVFIGHDHFTQNVQGNVNGNEIISCKGPAFSDSSVDNGFNSVLLDTENMHISISNFIFDSDVYTLKNTTTDKNILPKSSSIYKPTNKFYNSLSKDNSFNDGRSFEDYFVFPCLESIDSDQLSDDIVINNYEDFTNFLNHNNYISIEGPRKAGKTTLAKYLVKKLLRSYITLLIDEDELYSKKIHRIIPNAIKEAYGDQLSFDAFKQIDAKNKCLVVDGLTKGTQKNWEKFLNDNGKYFGSIIILCDSIWDFNIKSKTLNSLSKSQFMKLNLCPLYYDKREELINKICQSKHFSIENIDVDELALRINEYLTSEIKYFITTPSFVYKFVEYYLNPHKGYGDYCKNIFSEVYSANIANSIMEIVDDNSMVNQMMVALEFVAFKIHFEKHEFEITLSDFFDAIDNYKKTCDISGLNNNNVKDIAIKANIIKEDNETNRLQFMDEYILAYFVARYISRINQYNEEIIDINELISNISIGINGDIILFLSFIKTDFSILDKILTSLKSHMSEWDEFIIDTKNIKFICDDTISDELSAPNESDKKKIKKDKIKREKQIYKDKDNIKKDIYKSDNDNVDTYENKIIKGLKLLDLTAKILPSFFYTLNGDKKREISELLYRYPNRLLYYMFKDFDDNYAEIVDSIYKSFSKTSNGQLLSRDTIGREIQSQAVAYTLTLYDMISSTCSTVDTISSLESFDYNCSINNKLQNLLMLENIGRFMEFSERAIQLNKLPDNLNVTRKMLKLIVRKYFLLHKIKNHNESTRLIDNIFGKDKRKDMKFLHANKGTTKR